MSDEEDWCAAGFGIYIHWPFCLAKCPYCDFNSHVARTVDHDAFRARLIGEMEAARALTGARRADTIFFGGGTPSLMEPATVGALIEATDRLWGLAPDAEITLEANPTSVEAGKLRAFAAGGVNRVSMGAQALNDRDLRLLGRTHSADEARAAFAVARDAFARVSFDLIYARQDQTPEAWAAELYEAVSMAVDHLSLYQLTIEPGTRFGELHERGRLRGLPPDDRAADLYFATQETLLAAGMPAYEISNHARPGSESRHNLIYWRYGDYAGIGPGAHGRLTLGGRRHATETERDPGRWLAAPPPEPELLPEGAESDEYALMALRLTEGMDLVRHARLAGAPIPEARIAPLAEEGLLRREGGRLAATAAGRPVLNAILAALLG
ncbi:MAG: radical SAM family heme chaperone HemW [Pikeienuella sp.]|uniref:radical SAM family heme chaperone HemW n=1 Tax=Pikeienuella sp. TaxID=2831957 RepID=UPI0039192408